MRLPRSSSARPAGSGSEGKKTLLGPLPTGILCPLTQPTPQHVALVLVPGAGMWDALCVLGMEPGPQRARSVPCTHCPSPASTSHPGLLPSWRLARSLAVPAVLLEETEPGAALLAPDPDGCGQLFPGLCFWLASHGGAQARPV